MVGTKLKSSAAVQIGGPGQAVAAASHQTLGIKVDVCVEDKTSRMARVLNSTSSPLDCAEVKPIRRECVSDLEHISESILHDLRNPLAAIHGAAEMILDADLPPVRVKRLAGNIYDASRRIQELLQDLFNISRGKIRAPETSSLHEIAVAACESLSASAESCGTTLAVGIQPEIEVPLERGRMQRAFVNLITNAIEAMPGGGEVRISAELAADSVVVHVDDTGPGIAPEIRPELFRPFVTAGKRNGLGLGLAFTRQTALDHGGDLWVDSAPGGGARFSLRLPGARLVRLQTAAL
jgi:signal transduction histidine kinase